MGKNTWDEPYYGDGVTVIGSGLTRRQAIVRLRDTGWQWNEIAAHFGVGEAAVRQAVRRGKHAPERRINCTEEDALALLENAGYQVVKTPLLANREFPIDLDGFHGDVFRLGLISDTHFGSKHAQLTHVHTAYAHFKEAHVDRIIHAGDLVDGENIYRGHRYELVAVGADNQIDYTLERYPKVGIVTDLLGGNHDVSFVQSVGLDIARRISSESDIFRYIGALGAYLCIGGMRIYVHHPKGGLGYARTYRLQKILEQMAPENRPDIMVCGHWHSNALLPDYQGTFAMAIGCMQSQTPYELALGLNPEVGYGILEIEIKNGRAIRLSPNWYKLPVTRPHDF